MSKDNTIKIDVASLRESMGLRSAKKPLSESYVISSKNFDLKTELLSEKNKAAQLKNLEGYVKSVNSISAQLDSVDRTQAGSTHSEFRSLKIDESHNLNAAFLTGMFLDNISDLRSQLSMDSLSFMRLERDFGTFDEWQKDFIACCLSSRDGWSMTVYNAFLGRYVNVVVDSHALHMPINCYPVIVMDMSKGAYYRDYLNDKKTYVFAMMKELNWDVIDGRVKKSERIAKIMAS